MRYFNACVRNERLILEEPTDLAEGTLLELVSTDDVLNNGGDLLDLEERAALALELDAADAEVNAGETIDAAEAMAELRAEGTAADPEWGWPSVVASTWMSMIHLPVRSLRSYGTQTQRCASLMPMCATDDSFSMRLPTLSKACSSNWCRPTTC